MKLRMSETEKISPAEAAAILGVSLATFRRRLADGIIPLPKPDLGPYLKRPRKILYDRADVERLAQGLAASCLSQPRKEG